MSSDTCNATTADGTPCENSACRSDGRCWIHTQTDESADNGRPSKLNSHPEIADLIIEEIEHGATVKEALAEVEQKTGVYISHSTYRNWMQKGKDETNNEHFIDFRTGVTRARELSKRDERKSIKQQAIENDDVRLQWKIHMEQYGDEYADEQTETKSPPFALPEDVIDKWQHTDTQA
jgi:IS30 family transposase